MLSEQERLRIAEELKQHDYPRGAISEALLIVQEHRGWVPDEALPELASLLGVSQEEVEAIATFYELIFRHPVGRHVILLCDSVSCWVMGHDAIRDRLRTRLGIGPGETTPDGRFTLLPTVCLGACDRAPAMMIDGELHGQLDPGTIDAILAKYP